MLIFLRLGVYGSWFIILVVFLYGNGLRGRWTGLGWGVRLNEFITETFDTFDIIFSFGEFLIDVHSRGDARHDGHDRESLSVEGQHIYVIETLNLFK
jgi:hypothetical protein